MLAFGSPCTTADSTQPEPTRLLPRCPLDECQAGWEAQVLPGLVLHGPVTTRGPDRLGLLKARTPYGGQICTLTIVFVRHPDILAPCLPVMPAIQDLGTTPIVRQGAGDPGPVKSTT